MEQKTIHRYEILDKIGEGGMGVVYRARDPRIDRIVAIKTIKFGSGEDQFEIEEKKKRFYREAKTSGKLFHQNIVTILDVDEFEDFSYIVMEYVEGETLARRLRGGQALDQDEALSIVFQTCNALSYAHGVGIIHRDIKPSNIMLIGRDQVKVADFGLAKMLSSTSANITRTGGVVGTPFYMAPEQIRGEPSDARIDIFSLGVVLYECLTGSKPFVGDSISTIIYRILHEEPICIREFNRSYAPALESIVRKALAKSPGDRYQSALELGEEIRAFVDQDRNIRERTASLEKSPFPLTEASESSKNNRKMVAAGSGHDQPRSSASVSIGSRTQARNLSEVQTGLLEPDELIMPELPAGGSKKRRGLLPSIIGIVGLLLLILVAWPYMGRMVKPVPGTASPPPTAVAFPGGEHPSPGDATPPTGVPTGEPGADGMIVSPHPTIPVTVPPGITPDENQETAFEAHLEVRGEPAEATLFIDGIQVGKTPASPKVKKGPHRVEVKKDGFESFSAEIVIDGSASNPTLLPFSLKPRTVTARINTIPEGAEVTIDGAPVGSTPVARLSLSMGSHILGLKRKNYKPHSETIEAKPGQPLIITRTLVPAGVGSLTINALPWAEISIDGENRQSTPKSIAAIPSGLHSVRLTNPAFPPFETVVEVNLNESVKVYHDFEKSSFGTLQVNADPWGSVTIDGNLEGDTPISRKLAVGKHLVVISAPGHSAQSFDVEIKNGETVKVKAELETLIVRPSIVTPPETPTTDIMRCEPL